MSNRSTPSNPCPVCGSGGKKCKPSNLTGAVGALCHYSKFVEFPKGATKVGMDGGTWVSIGADGLVNGTHFKRQGSDTGEQRLKRVEPRFDHHAAARKEAQQLRVLGVIRRLLRRHPELTVGVEMTTQWLEGKGALYHADLYSPGPRDDGARRDLQRLASEMAHTEGFDADERKLLRGALHPGVTGCLFEWHLSPEGRPWHARISYLVTRNGEKMTGPAGFSTLPHFTLGWRTEAKALSYCYFAEGARKANEIARHLGVPCISISGISGLKRERLGRHIASELVILGVREARLAPDVDALQQKGRDKEQQSKFESQRNVIAGWGQHLRLHLANYLDDAPVQTHILALTWPRALGNGPDDALAEALTRDTNTPQHALPPGFQILEWGSYIKRWKWVNPKQVRTETSAPAPAKPTAIVGTVEEGFEASLKAAAGFASSSTSLALGGSPGTAKTTATRTAYLDDKNAPNTLFIAFPTRDIATEKAASTRKSLRSSGRDDVVVLTYYGRKKNGEWNCRDASGASDRAAAGIASCVGCHLAVKCSNTEGEWAFEKQRMLGKIKAAHEAGKRVILTCANAAVDSLLATGAIPVEHAGSFDDISLIDTVTRVVEFDDDVVADALERAEWAAERPEVAAEFAFVAKWVARCCRALLASRNMQRTSPLLEAHDQLAPEELNKLLDPNLAPRYDPGIGRAVWPWEAGPTEFGGRQAPASLTRFCLGVLREIAWHIPPYVQRSTQHERGLGKRKTRVFMPRRQVIADIRSGRHALCGVGHLPAAAIESLRCQGAYIHAEPEGIRFIAIEGTYLSGGKRRKLNGKRGRSPKSEEAEGAHQGGEDRRVTVRGKRGQPQELIDGDRIGSPEDQLCRQLYVGLAKQLEAGGLVRIDGRDHASLGAVVLKSDKAALAESPEFPEDQLEHTLTYGSGHLATDELMGVELSLVRDFAEPLTGFDEQAEILTRALDLARVGDQEGTQLERFRRALRRGSIGVRGGVGRAVTEWTLEGKSKTKGDRHAHAVSQLMPLAPLAKELHRCSRQAFILNAQGRSRLNTRAQVEAGVERTVLLFAAPFEGAPRVQVIDVNDARIQSGVEGNPVQIVSPDQEQLDTLNAARGRDREERLDRARALVPDALHENPKLTAPVLAAWLRKQNVKVRDKDVVALLAEARTPKGYESLLIELRGALGAAQGCSEGADTSGQTALHRSLKESRLPESVRSPDTASLPSARELCRAWGTGAPGDRAVRRLRVDLLRDVEAGHAVRTHRSDKLRNLARLAEVTFELLANGAHAAPTEPRQTVARAPHLDASALVETAPTPILAGPQPKEDPMGWHADELPDHVLDANAESATGATVEDHGATQLPAAADALPPNWEPIQAGITVEVEVVGALESGSPPPPPDAWDGDPDGRQERAAIQWLARLEEQEHLAAQEQASRGAKHATPRPVEVGPMPLVAVAGEVALAAQEPVQQRGLNGGGDVADLPNDAAAWSARWGRAPAVDLAGVTAVLQQAGEGAWSAGVFADIAFDSNGVRYTAETLHAANARIARFQLFGTPLDDNQADVDALVERQAVGLAFSTVEAMDMRLVKARAAPAVASIPLADFVIGYPASKTWAGQHSDRDHLRRVLAGAFEEALVASG